LRQDCVELYTATKILEETSVAAVLLEYRQEGMDAEAAASQIKRRFLNLPIILFSAYSEIPERILWLVDEYLTKNEQGLARILQRTTRCRDSDLKHTAICDINTAS
jgi:CheY-like chemotaxis protein